VSVRPSNDATREAGGTLGVAIIGSVFTSIYAHHLAGTSIAALPHHVVQAAKDSVGAAISVATGTPGATGHQLIADVNGSFMSGLHVACLVAAGVCWLGAVGALALPGRRALAARTQPSVVATDREPAFAG
jgi:hypothetical protein